MIKRFIAVVVFSALFVPQLPAAERSSYDFTEYTPQNAALRSAVFPGWGQFFNQEQKKGYIVGAAFWTTALTSYLLYTQANKIYDDYERTGIKNDALYSDYETKSNQAMLVSLVAVGSWIYGIADAYLTANSVPEAEEKEIGEETEEDPEQEQSFKMDMQGNTLALVFQKRFQ